MPNYHREVYAVTDLPEKEGQQAKSRWTRIGVTFQNKDGSETVVLDALPINGRLVLREPREAKADAPDAK